MVLLGHMHLTEDVDDDYMSSKLKWTAAELLTMLNDHVMFTYVYCNYMLCTPSLLHVG